MKSRNSNDYFAHVLLRLLQGQLAGHTVLRKIHKPIVDEPSTMGLWERECIGSECAATRSPQPMDLR